MFFRHDTLFLSASPSRRDALCVCVPSSRSSCHIAHRSRRGGGRADAGRGRLRRPRPPPRPSGPLIRRGGRGRLRRPRPPPRLSRPVIRRDACVALVPLILPHCPTPTPMGDASVPTSQSLPPLRLRSFPFHCLYTLGKYIYTPSTSTGNCGSTR